MVQLMPLPSQTPSSLTLFKSRLVLLFWYWLTQVVLEKGPLNSCGSSSSSSTYLVSIKALENRYCNVDKLKRAQKPVIVCVCRMDASGQQLGDDDYAPLTVMLSHFFTHRDNLFIQVETTAPPPRKKKRRSLIRCSLLLCCCQCWLQIVVYNLKHYFSYSLDFAC